MRWIGYGTAVFVLMWMAQMATPISVYISVPSVTFVTVLGVSIIVASHGLRALAVVHRAALGRLSARDYSLAHQVTDTGRRSFIGSGWVGVVIGAVQVLHSLDDPSKLGGPLALSLLTALYGHLFALLFWLPLQRSLGETRPA